MRPAVRAAARIASPVARTGLRFRTTPGLTVLGWHRIGEPACGLTTTPADFRRHLDVLQEWGATVLDLPEAMRRLGDGTLPARAVALTFDDGYASVAELAWPELKARSMPATLFAVSGYLAGNGPFPWDATLGTGHPLTRLLSARELRDVADDGLTIGSHTVTHRWLPGLGPDAIEEELVRSRAELEDLLQRPVRELAYPMGGWNEAIRDASGRAGYRYAITVDRGANSAHQDPLALRRAFAFHRGSDVRRQLDGAFTWMRPIEDRRRRREPTW